MFDLLRAGGNGGDDNTHYCHKRNNQTPIPCAMVLCLPTVKEVVDSLMEKTLKIIDGLGFNHWYLRGALNVPVVHLLTVGVFGRAVVVPIFHNIDLCLS